MDVSPTAVRIDEHGRLHCPFCDGDYVHLDLVHIGARQEDKPPYRISVDAVAGTVDEAPAFGEPLSRRRQWVELVVNCEFCPGGSVVLAQHKGQTEVSVRPPG